MILMNVDSENVSKRYEEDLYDLFSRKIETSHVLSEITQTANSIKMSVKTMEGSVSSLTIDVNGIKGEVYDEYGESRIEQLSDSVSLSVKRGVNYNGMKITSSGISCTGTGSFTVNMANLTIDSSGNVTIKGNVEATSGKIGNFTIGDYQLEYDGHNFVGYSPSQRAYEIGYAGYDLMLSGGEIQIGDTYIGGEIYIDSNGIGLYKLDAISCGTGGAKNVEWRQLSNILDTDYVLCEARKG